MRQKGQGRRHWEQKQDTQVCKLHTVTSISIYLIIMQEVIPEKEIRINFTEYEAGSTPHREHSKRF